MEIEERLPVKPKGRPRTFNFTENYHNEKIFTSTALPETAHRNLNFVVNAEKGTVIDPQGIKLYLRYRIVNMEAGKPMEAVNKVTTKTAPLYTLFSGVEVFLNNCAIFKTTVYPYYAHFFRSIFRPGVVPDECVRSYDEVLDMSEEIDFGGTIPHTVKFLGRSGKEIFVPNWVDRASKQAKGEYVDVCGRKFSFPFLNTLCVQTYSIFFSPANRLSLPREIHSGRLYLEDLSNSCQTGLCSLGYASVPFYKVPSGN